MFIVLSRPFCFSFTYPFEITDLPVSGLFFCGEFRLGISLFACQCPTSTTGNNDGRLLCEPTDVSLAVAAVLYVGRAIRR